MELLPNLPINYKRHGTPTKIKGCFLRFSCAKDLNIYSACATSRDPYVGSKSYPNDGFPYARRRRILD